MISLHILVGKRRGLAPRIGDGTDDRLTVEVSRRVIPCEGAGSSSLIGNRKKRAAGPFIGESKLPAQPVGDALRGVIILFVVGVAQKVSVSINNVEQSTGTVSGASFRSG